jgi:hypothetical protein
MEPKILPIKFPGDECCWPMELPWVARFLDRHGSCDVSLQSKASFLSPSSQYSVLAITGSASLENRNPCHGKVAELHPFGFQHAACV